MAGLSTGAGAPVVKVYHEKSMILPDVSRVLACLCEKDVKFECVKDSYKDILRLQASRSVPVPFYDGPTFLQESRAICRYIAETYKQHGYPFLLGKDVLERASIEQWLRHEEHAFDPPSRALFCHLAFPLHDEDDDDINREKRKLEEVLEVYEQRLGESEFLAGNKFTLADLVHLPNTHHIVTSKKFAYLYDSRKNVQRWWNTISARDSWQQVLRDMKSVKEQYQMEEHEQQQQLLLLQYQMEEHEQQQQQQQWQTEPPPTNGGRNIRIDRRTHTGTESRTILVPPPSTGFIAASFSSVQQEEQPPPAKTTSHDKSSPIQQKESNFFTTTEKTPSPSRQTTQKPRNSVQSTRSTFFTPATSPTTTKTPPRTETDKSSSKDASSPTKPSQTSSKESPDKIHLSDFYKASSHTDEAATLTKPTPPEASKTSNRIHEARQTSEAAAPDKPSPRSAKAPQEIDEPDFYETESKPDSVGPWVDKPVSYTKPDPQTPKTPYTRSPAQRAADTSGPEAGETSSDQRTAVQTPYAQQRSEQEKMASTDQRTAAHLAEKVAAKDAQGETAPQAGHRGARDITKEAREVHQRRATSAPTRELPSGAQNGHQQNKAPPTDLKVSDLSPSEAEFKEDAQGAMSGDERFSSKRLRKMFEESEAAVLRSQSTDLQAPAKEETPSVYKKPSDVQDRKKQASTVSADGKMGTPSTGTRAPETSTSADERRDQRRATSAPTRELPSGAQNGHQHSKAPPTDLKVSDLSPSEAEFKEDAQGALSGDERFSSKRLRKMFEESEAAVLRSQSTDLQAPAKEETPSVYKKPSDVQGRKKQASTVSADGKIGTPSTGTRAPETSTSADERRATSPPKGGMAHDDHGATEPRKSPSSNEQEPAPPVPSQSPTTSAGRDDDLAQLSTIDQWQHTSAPPSPIQQVSPGAPSIDELTKTAGVDRRAQISTPKKTPTDARNALAPVQGAAPSADGISDEQSDKSIMVERAPEMTPRQAPSSDTRRTSASIEEAIRVPRGPSNDMLGKTSGTDQIATPAASKQTPARGEVPDVRDTGDDTTKRPAVDTKAAPTPPRQEPVSSSQQTTEQIKGVAPTSHGITGDESAKIAMADESATPPAPASYGRVASTALKGGILDARGKNEAVKPSVADPRGMPTTPRRPAPTPDTQRRTTSSKVASTERKFSQSDEMVSQAAVRMHGQQHSAGNKGALNNQASDQAPPLPSFAETRNDKTGIAEAGRINTIAPDEQPGGRIPKNAGAPAARPSPMKSQKNMNEAYNDGPSIQQLSSDQSRAQLAGNKKKQGDDATPLTEIGKPKEDGFLANANQNNTGQAQVTSTDGPSKLQMQSDQNKPISNDIGKRTNETVSFHSSATFREMLPSVPEKSMRENQLQGDKSSISLQDNVKQGSEAALSVSGTEQPKKRDLLTNADQNSGKTPGEALQKSEERTSSDTQQVKSNTSNSKSDGSSKPTQFDGNEGNLPESQRRGSSTNP